MKDKKLISNEYYTTQPLIDEVMEYLYNMYPNKKFIWEANLKNGMIFKFGGDYTKYDYSCIPNDTIIVFNPPFQIYKQVCEFMNDHGIKFVSFCGLRAWFKNAVETLKWIRKFGCHHYEFKNTKLWNSPNGLVNRILNISLITNIDLTNYIQKKIFHPKYHTEKCIYQNGKIVKYKITYDDGTIKYKDVGCGQQKKINTCNANLITYDQSK